MKNNAIQRRSDALQKSTPRAIPLVLALSFLLFITNPFDSLEDEFVRYDADSMPSHYIAANITIYIYGGVHENDSIFRTNTLQRFGTGRFAYSVHDMASTCDNNSCNNRLDAQMNDITVDDYSSSSSPCLAISKHYGPRFGYCHHDALRCSHPQCKTMIEGDEMCKVANFDARQYYSADIPNSGYLPLGPRLDSWSALQLLQKSPEFFMKPPSSRRYAFNAIFSMVTSKGRRYLANQLNRTSVYNVTLPMYTSISGRWASMTEVDAVDTGIENKLNPLSYTEVLLDSIFTLSPAGHNPECFRMFEAVEAGSIPVLVKDDLYATTYAGGACLEPLQHWRDAPILVLDSWDDLYPTVVRLLGDLEALHKMQRDLGEWYEGYMRKIVRDFEDFLMTPIDSSVQANQTHAL